MSLELTNSQYDRLMDSYQMLRFEAKNIRREHTLEAYEKIPELKSLDKELIAAMSSDDIDSLDYKLSDIEKRKKELLVKNGYPDDYLSLTYNCNDCNDTGFINGNRCHCFKNMIIKQIYGENTWRRLFERENFDTFDISLYKEKDSKESAINALSKSKEFISDILSDTKTDRNNLIIMGMTGVGKTFLCNCIAKELIENEKFVLYLTASALFEIFEKYAFSGKKNPLELSEEIQNVHYKNLFDCDLLIIDDLGSEFSNTYTKPKLLELINKRIINCSPTLISTNLDMMGIKREYTERLASRITGSFRYIQIIGRDIRVEKTLNSL